MPSTRAHRQYAAPLYAVEALCLAAFLIVFLAFLALPGTAYAHEPVQGEPGLAQEFDDQQLGASADGLALSVIEGVDAGVEAETAVAVNAAKDEPAEEVETVGEVAAPPVLLETDRDSLDLLPSNDDLFAGYVDKVFNDDHKLTAQANYADARYADKPNMLLLCNALKEKCTQVANGEISSTVFEFSTEELGLSINEISKDAVDGGLGTITRSGSGLTGTIRDEAINELAYQMFGYESFYAVLNELNNMLLSDLPYEMYWYDKVYSSGAVSLARSMSYRYNASTLEMTSLILTNLYFTFRVSSDYSANGTAGETTTNLTKTRAASHALENVLAIVERNKDKGDFEKLLAYKEEICRLTDYDYSAADDNNNTPYGNPWQLIHIFDGDPNTKVVCEGYSKGFQLLCDKSIFAKNVTSYIVTGNFYYWNSANRPSSPPGGSHMWNHVVIDGRTFLVDTTNCDKNNATSAPYSNDGLFMIGYTSSITNGFIYKSKVDNYYHEYNFFDSDVRLYAGTSVLSICPLDYANFIVDELSAPDALTYGYASSSSSSVSVSASLEGYTSEHSSKYPAYSLRYQWYRQPSAGEPIAISGATSSSCPVPAGLAAGDHRFFCKIGLYNADHGVVVERNTAFITVSIAKKTISVSSVSGVETSKVYDGTTAAFGTPVITLAGVLDGDRVFAVSASFAYDSADVNSARKITVSGIYLTGDHAQNYKLLLTMAYVTARITSKPITDATVTIESGPFTYAGHEISPAVISVSLDGVALDVGADYTVTHEDNDKAGTARVVVSGANNYGESAEVNFTIDPASISVASVTLSKDSYAYDGSEHTPSVSLSAFGKSLSYGIDYVVIYPENRVNAGTYELKVMGMHSFEDDTSVSFSIDAANISSSSVSVTLSETNFTYDGAQKTPGISVSAFGKPLILGTDYTISYPTGRVNAGTYRLNINAVVGGNFTGKKTMNYTISPALITAATLSVSKTNFTYNGALQRPAIAMSAFGNALIEGTDFVVNYPEDSTAAGSYELTIVGYGNFAETRSLGFSILPAPLSSAALSLSDSAFTYNGAQQRPVVTMRAFDGTLALDADYTVSYPEFSEEKGSYELTISGANNYTGEVTAHYDINAAPISSAVITLSKTSYDFDGTEKRPVVTVTAFGATLVLDADYSIVEPIGCVNAGTYSFGITGRGNFEGTTTADYVISPMPISSAFLTLSRGSYTYDKGMKTPTVSLSAFGDALVEGIDYAVAYPDGRVNAGTYTITISGTGNYSGTRTQDFVISAAPITIASLALSATSYVYDATVKTPTVTLSAFGAPLVLGSDYSVSYPAGSRAKGSYTLTVTGSGNYAGSMTADYSISAASIASASITLSATSYVYDSTVKTPTVSVSAFGSMLVSGADYSVSYPEGRVNAGSYSITVTGLGNFEGSRNANFSITSVPISSASLELSASSFTYDATVKKPTITLSAYGSTLSLETDYAVSYPSGCIDAGNYTITITGSGNFSGSRTASYSILQASLSTAALTLSTSSYTYDGTEKRPSVTLAAFGGNLELGSDFTLEYKNNAKAGTATVTASGKGNFYGYKSAMFTISKRAFDDGVLVTLSAASFPYTGASVRPTPSVKFGSKLLAVDTDYTVSYPAVSIEQGTYELTVTGKGNFEGAKTVSYVVAAGSISAATITLSTTTYTYDGTEKMPGLGVKMGSTDLYPGVDYTVAYPSGCVKPGAYELVVSGLGNYVGSKKVSFTIAALPISASTMKLSATSYVYDGEMKMPSVTVSYGGKTLFPGRDYTVSYPEGCVNAGSYAVTITGMGNYAGYKSTSFVISPREFDGNVTVSLPTTSYVYSGTAIKPVPIVKALGKTLAQGADYGVSYSASPVNAGTYIVTVTGKGNHHGIKTTSFSITPLSLATALVSVGDVTYGGSALSPAPTVALGGRVLAAGVNYTISYGNNASVGTALVTIRGTGNYAGMAEASFDINPMGTKLSKLVAAKKAITVKWAKQAKKMSSKRVTGYEICYSSNSSMASAKTKVVKGYSKSSIKLSKLKAKKKYYIQIRTYMNIGGKSYYSAWSSKKSVKTK